MRAPIRHRKAADQAASAHTRAETPHDRTYDTQHSPPRASSHPSQQSVPSIPNVSSRGERLQNQPASAMLGPPTGEQDSISSKSQTI